MTVGGMGFIPERLLMMMMMIYGMSTDTNTTDTNPYCSTLPCVVLKKCKYTLPGLVWTKATKTVTVCEVYKPVNL